MFRDREDAGQKLARALTKYKDTDALVLAIPRGGVEVGYHVATYLNARLSILVSRKLPYPDNPEAGFGAVAEDGSTFIFEDAVYWLSKETIERILRQQKEEIRRRIAVLRKGEPLPEIAQSVVILVDDGIAMGSTVRAGILLCRNKEAAKVVVAAPVAGESVERELSKLADEVVILEKPPFFRAVAQVYYNWYDVPDKEVLGIMERWETEHRAEVGA
ncbi:MAG: phosphoribosyltransferase family protein [bacterium]|nr:phosphoribosyltransferase family protein [bacterium]